MLLVEMSSSPVWFNQMEYERANSAKTLSYNEVHFLLANLMKVLGKKGIDTAEGVPRDMWHLNILRYVAAAPLFMVFFHIFRVMSEHNIGLEQVLCADPALMIDSQVADNMMLYFGVYPSVVVQPIEAPKPPAKTHTQQRRRRAADTA